MVATTALIVRPMNITPARRVSPRRGKLIGAFTGGRCGRVRGLGVHPHACAGGVAAG